ncbi:Cytochrome c oxidase subunit 6A1, mitochondrial [Coemansia sp. S85]|nr:Cytochrome c oxidase subunit 6A1, mitochondrial [Coemansia sp. S85]
MRHMRPPRKPQGVSSQPKLAKSLKSQLAYTPIVARRTANCLFLCTSNKCLASVETWRKISLFVAVPSVVIFSYVATKEELDHIHHLEHDPPKFVAYPYLRIRRRKLPYGDGDHTPFSNPLVNPDPEE